jgi:hypothetical protein
MDQAEELISTGGWVGGGLEEAVVADVGGGEGCPVCGGQIGILQERPVGGIGRPRHQRLGSADMLRVETTRALRAWLKSKLPCQQDKVAIGATNIVSSVNPPMNTIQLTPAIYAIPIAER